MDCSVVSSTGKQTSLLSLWKSRKIVLCFLRQLGCRFCMQRTKKLMAIQKQLMNENVDLVLVSLGTPKQAIRFLHKTGFQGELYVDPSSDGKVRTALNSQQAVAYSFFRLKRGSERVTNPHTQNLSKELAALGLSDWSDLVDDPEKTEQGGIMEWAGDPFQVGGTFVLGSGNTCDYVYRSKYAGDHPPLNLILEAVTGKNAKGEEITHTQAAKWASMLHASVKHVSVRSGSRDNTGAGTGEREEKSAAVVEHCCKSVDLSKASSAIASSAVVVGACSQLRTYLPFEIVALQTMPILRYWPEFVLSQIMLGCIAVLYDTFVFHKEQKVGHTTSTMAAKRNITKEDNAPTAPTTGSNTSNNDDDDKDIKTLPRQLSLGGQVVEFMKVSDIDAMLLQQGFIDGVKDEDLILSFLDMEQTPSQVLSPVPKETDIVRAANPTCRARGDTWDASLGVNEYSIILQYIRKFLAKTHRDIGRSGPVCPFVPKSLRKDALHLTVIRTGKGSRTDRVREDIEEYLKVFAREFTRMEPTTGSARAFKAAIFIFPDITLDQTTICIDGVQEACKPYYVRRGLMLGEFHLRNNSPGLRNEHFYPLRTPVPCLAVRHMVPTDLAFLDVSKYEKKLRIEFLTSFLDVFGASKVYKNYSEVVKAKELLQSSKNE